MTSFSNQNMDTVQINSSTTRPSSRFSLIILEPGEIYFEDYLVYYFDLSSTPEKMPSDKNKEKGNLKICSKSIVFDPLNLNKPLVKFPYKMIESINLNIDQDKKLFTVSIKQTISCKINNKISAYQVTRREKATDVHYFQFIFTNTDDSLDLLLQLHRASTLDYEQEELMLELILNSRLKRDFKKIDLLQQFEDVSKEQIVFESIVNKIEPLVKNPGKIILTNMCLYYKPFNNLLDDNYRNIKIKLENVKHVVKRRFQLKRIGCEIIFSNDDSINESIYQTNQDKPITHSKSLPYLYLTFESQATRNLFYNHLVVDQSDKLVNLEDFNQDNMLQKWRYGLISNFDYLTYLNNIADRSYNDLTQYLIFPWVLNDYASETLDLNDPSIYRDLSKPIGALNPKRLERLKQRCKEMQSSLTTLGKSDSTNHQNPFFLYGTHYSTPAFVSFYLVRQQPEWQLCLQNGRFDQANRLFHSVLDTWNNCMHLDSDVKELIPEFYDTNLNASSFLCNRLELDLGTRQDGVRVNDVILPKWASSPKEFVQKMRDALESSYVSENLHSWIDLIFGYKQRGEEALKADNLFYYLCYEGSVDLNSIKNYAERKSLEVQIQEFGQIPTLLFKTPHLARFKLTDMVEPTFRLNHELEMANVLKPLKNIIKSHVERDNNSLTKTNHPSLNFKDLTINLVLKSHHKSQINDCVFLNLNSEAGTDSTIKMPVIATVSSDNCLKMYSLEDRSLFRSHKVSNFSISSIDFADFATADQPGKNLLLFLSCWDNSVYVYSETYNRCIQKLDDLHEDAISRVRVLGKNSSSTFLLTASWDSLIKLWSMNNRTYRTKCLNEICHDSACLDFSISRSYLAIICKDGNLYMWKANSKLLEESDSANDEEDDEYDDSDQQLVKNEKDYFTYLFSIQNSNDIGQINDAFILEQPDDRVRATPNCTLAVCTSFGFVKIFNIENNTDLFSLKINIGDPARPDAASYNLKKILYSLDYIVTVDSSGYIYFVDLKQDQLITNTTTASTFLAHHLQVAPCSISSLCFHHDLNLFSLGDMDGNLYLISSDHLK